MVSHRGFYCAAVEKIITVAFRLSITGKRHMCLQNKQKQNKTKKSVAAVLYLKHGITFSFGTQNVHHCTQIFSSGIFSRFYSLMKYLPVLTAIKPVAIPVNISNMYVSTSEVNEVAPRWDAHQRRHFQWQPVCIRCHKLTTLPLRRGRIPQCLDIIYVTHYF